MRTRVRTSRPKANNKMRPMVREHLRRTAHYAADMGIREAKAKTRGAIQRAGLGKLAGAVGDTSSLRHPRWRGRGEKAWGAIYARGGVESRANQALSIYSQGGVIVPAAGRTWLAYADERTIGRIGPGRRRMTPALYRASGMEQSLGKLQFIQINPHFALYIIRDVSTSKRTGRAKKYGGRNVRGRVREPWVVAFRLIRFTKRAQRFNQDQIMREAQATMPRHAADYQSGRAGGAPRR